MQEVDLKIKEKRRFDNIDVMESLAMLFVIIYHQPIMGWDVLREPSVITYYNFFSRTILSTCVPIFFFCNGYLLLNKKFDLKKHICKIIRLIILTGIWGILSLLVLLSFYEHRLSLRLICSNLWNLPTSPANHLWFMGALIGLYLVFPLLKMTFDHDKRCFIFVISVCTIMTFGNNFLNMIITIIGNLFGFYNSSIDTNLFRMFNPFQNECAWIYVYFGLGGLMSYYESSIISIIKKNRKLVNIGLLILIVLSCMGLGLWGIFNAKLIGMWDYVWLGYETVFTLINTIVIYMLCLSYHADAWSKFSISKLIRLISENSIGIYFIHNLIGVAFCILVPYEILINNFICNTVYAMAILLVCIIVVNQIKKIPIIKLLV